MKAFKIGNITLEKPVILAPMCGVTDYPFRKLVASFGCQLTFSEMIASAGMIRNLSKSLSKLKKIPNTINAIQIVGNDKEAVSESVKMITDMGFDFIDINFGCPVKKVVNSMCGSAILKDLNEFSNIIEVATKATKIPITVKTRLGWNSCEVEKIAKIAENSGAKMITLHCRTRSQMFSGVADWSKISNLKEIISIPYIVNGDINTNEKLQEALNISNANGAMIARGIYGKPWLIGEMLAHLEGKDFDISINKNKIVKEHISEIYEYHENEQVSSNFSKKHLMFYTKYVNEGKRLREEIGRINTKKEMFDVINNFDFENVQE